MGQRLCILVVAVSVLGPWSLARSVECRAVRAADSL